MKQTKVALETALGTQLLHPYKDMYKYISKEHKTYTLFRQVNCFTFQQLDSILFGQKDVPQ